MSSPPQARPFMSSAYPLLGEFEVAITGGVWVAAGVPWPSLEKPANMSLVNGAMAPGLLSAAEIE